MKKSKEHLGGKHDAAKASMGKKESGFGAKLGKLRGKSGLEGPHGKK